jgi:hypothetical protein
MILFDGFKEYNCMHSEIHIYWEFYQSLSINDLSEIRINLLGFDVYYHVLQLFEIIKNKKNPY